MNSSKFGLQTCRLRQQLSHIYMGAYENRGALFGGSCHMLVGRKLPEAPKHVPGHHADT